MENERARVHLPSPPVRAARLSRRAVVAELAGLAAGWRLDPSADAAQEEATPQPGGTLRVADSIDATDVDPRSAT